MRNVTPELAAPQIRVAQDQPGFVPVTVVAVRDRQYQQGPDGFNTVVMAFRPTSEERAKLAAGEDIYVSLLTFGDPQQGIRIMAGREEAAAVLNVAPLRGGQSPLRDGEVTVLNGSTAEPTRSE